MYYIAEDQQFVKAETSLDRRNRSQRLINSIAGLMKYLKAGKKS
jgi:hypothetical protein